MKREFDFLPELPKSSLDDRKFADLVAECLLRIPRYCPEWTNHNPSDPGVTLIELFAWLTDQMLLRFNQIPRLNYIGFLELLGIKLQAPVPAKSEVTFYLTTSFLEQHTIPANTIIATERTETEEAIEFTTDTNLVITPPKIKHLLTATTKEITNFIDFSNWTSEADGAELRGGSETRIFDDTPNIGNCFYVVLNNDQIAGNVIVLNIKANAGTPTGINPQNPPRNWEAWTGEKWENILLKESDDNTQGFSFNTFKKQGGNPIEGGADITLHLPLDLPVTNFEGYEGMWIRCRVTKEGEEIPGYSNSPRIIAIAIRAIGGTVKITQSTEIENETLGESDGTPGQSFQLQQNPILTPKKDIEYITVMPPGEDAIPENWQQVDNFSDSRENDLHYTLDCITGKIQFGPLIREPYQIKESTWNRQKLPTNTEEIDNSGKFSKRQYGKVPLRGSTITMVKYRTGGGERGNVAKGTIKICKSAVPYIERIENHQPAKDGTNAESLEAAMMRVPQQLRTPNRAVTAEDFETLARRGSKGAIARTHCLPDQPGTVKLLLIPHVNLEVIETGIAPEKFNITDNLKKEVENYLEERRLLGIKIIYDQPKYLGICTHTKVSLQKEYKNEIAKKDIKNKILIALYQFLNPINGYFEQQGWPFNHSVNKADIKRLLQIIEGVGKIEWIKIYPIDPIIQDGNITQWQKREKDEEEIDLQPDQLICSWDKTTLDSNDNDNPQLDSAHKVYFD
ncbi:putative baseplate assembly protein [Anabaena sp. FACHB-1237]|uniref:putative baseplate assembly protein n=1 Tax=Anabaena sp. FACHB-1237 TaxID=2692769 RepID=UPI001680EA61|nr:putative baseplate assembly protein [Anabaena sp. FACHB-1237]MBD2137765.1 putative baseplate assembly protein [Anabaena sp. FACHB-1237]